MLGPCDETPGPASITAVALPSPGRDDRHAGCVGPARYDGGGGEQGFEQRGAFGTGDAPGDDPAAENIDADIEMEADFNANVKSSMRSSQRNIEKSTPSSKRARSTTPPEVSKYLCTV